MKKNNTLIIAVVLTMATVSLLLLVYNMPIGEDRYNKVMCYYIARSVTSGKDTPQKKICALRDFVHINIHPIAGYDNRLDVKAIDKLVSGVGWCDQQARVFMQLARAIGVNTRLLSLISAERASCHSVVEAQMPSGRWVIIDPFFNLEFKNKIGKLASQQDIKENPAIITDNDKIVLRQRYDKRWRNPDFISMYYNTARYVVEKRGTTVDLLKFIPLSWIRLVDRYIADRYIAQARNGFKDEFELKMLKARTYHLIGYYKESRALYRDIISASKNPYLVYKAEYYKAMLFKNQKQYDKGLYFLNNVIAIHDDNPYEVYDIGLMSRILDKIGNVDAASDSRRAIGFDPLAS